MGRGRGRGSSTRGTRGRGRGRGKRTTRIVSSEEENSNETSNNEKLEIQEESENQNETFNEQPQQEPTSIVLPSTKDVEMVEEKEFEEQQPHKFDMEGDISKLEAPTFTTLTRNIPQPMTQLTWDHKVNLIGDKLISPMIHFCDQCNKPILIYGRMIPCKHVFCLKCARTDFKNCPRCNDKVVRVEKNGFPIYLCTHGGTLYGSTGCRRTYLSQRDLDAHIKHRHLPIQTQEAKLASVTNPSNVIIQHQRKDSLSSLQPQNLPLTASHINVLQNSLQSQSTSRTSLISVALQDNQHPSRPLIPSSSQQPQPHESSQLGHNLYYNQMHQSGSTNSGGQLPGNYSAGGVQMIMQQQSQHNRPSQTASSYYPPQHSQSQWNQQPYYR